MANIKKNSELWACDIAYCNYIYNPEIGDPGQGIARGTLFEDLPDGWRCPVCGVDTDNFHLYEP